MWISKFLPLLVAWLAFTSAQTSQGTELIQAIDNVATLSQNLEDFTNSINDTNSLDDAPVSLSIDASESFLDRSI